MGFFNILFQFIDLITFIKPPHHACVMLGYGDEPRMQVVGKLAVQVSS